MNNFKQYQQQAVWIMAGGLLLSNLVLGGLLWLAWQYRDLPLVLTGAIVVVAMLVITLLVATIVARAVSQPFQAIWRAILHVATEQSSVPAPQLEHVRTGRALVASLVPQIYQLASGQAGAETAPPANQSAALTALKTLPLPVIVVGKSLNITFANEAALKYFGPETSLIGTNVNESLKLLFTNEHTVEAWLNENMKSTLTATEQWQRVRITDKQGATLHQADLAAYYNQGLGDEVAASLVFFDRTADYGKDDTAITFVSLAVHELRTPLTIMRGYIEALEDELKGKLDPELTEFMHRLSASAQQLSSFVGNILNVARIEEDQLALRLEEHSWPDILHSAANDMSLRAEVNGKRIEFNIHSGLPAVAVDKMSIYEVVNNLLDNAIKYSGKSNRIIISSRETGDGFVETTVQDFGRGIAANVMPHIFDKFYRNHSSREQVGGTGLGLYLCKAIIQAHGGNIWVRSNEGEGAVFGFSLQTYDRLAAQGKNGNNEGVITTSAHGWIKNHSLYRR